VEVEGGHRGTADWASGGRSTAHALVHSGIVGAIDMHRSEPLPVIGAEQHRSVLAIFGRPAGWPSQMQPAVLSGFRMPAIMTPRMGIRTKQQYVNCMVLVVRTPIMPQGLLASACKISKAIARNAEKRRESGSPMATGHTHHHRIPAHVPHIYATPSPAVAVMDRNPNASAN
jgi:hypothetical protein